MTFLTAQPSDTFTPSVAVLLCLGKYNQLSALEYWLAHHLALGMTPFISFSKEVEDAQKYQEILKILSRRYPIEILESGLESETAEAVFYQKATEKRFFFALRLALDEFLYPDYLETKTEISEHNALPALKIPYRHCGLLGHDPQKILKLGLNPRHYYTKMTDGAFALDTQGRFLSALQDKPEAFPLALQQAIILHDAAGSALSEPAQKFFDQGSKDIPSQASPFRVEEIVATMWQDVLRHYLTIHKNFPQWLMFKPAMLTWHFFETENGNVLGINHQTRELCHVPPCETLGYSRLILAKKDATASETDGWLCLFDPAPFSFLPLKGINARTPALAVKIKQEADRHQLETAFTQTRITLENQDDFTLSPLAKRDLPYPLAALDRVLLKGKENPIKKQLLDGFPTPPVTALWALMTRPEFFHENKPFSLFSLLKALLNNEKYFPPAP